MLLTYDLFRKLHVEADEKLQNIYHQLLQAGADKHESDREAKLKETLASLQGIFPGPFTYFPFLLAMIVILRLSLSGVRGRIVDLCKPIQRKYETAVSVVLGRNIDAIVVDEEKTAIDCIEVTSHFLCLPISGKSNVLNQVLLVYAQPTCRSSHFHSTGHHTSQTYQ